MALDSCARVIVLLDRTDAASGLGDSFAGAMTESADGTEVLVTGDCVESGWILTGLTSGTGGSELPILQAPSDSSVRQRAARVT
jgi:hypothetical protein